MGKLVARWDYILQIWVCRPFCCLYNNYGKQSYGLCPEHYKLLKKDHATGNRREVSLP